MIVALLTMCPVDVAILYSITQLIASKIDVYNLNLSSDECSPSVSSYMATNMYFVFPDRHSS